MSILLFEDGWGIFHIPIKHTPPPGLNAQKWLTLADRLAQSFYKRRLRCTFRTIEQYEAAFWEEWTPDMFATVLLRRDEARQVVPNRQICFHGLAFAFCSRKVTRLSRNGGQGFKAAETLPRLIALQDVFRSTLSYSAELKSCPYTDSRYARIQRGKLVGLKTFISSSTASKVKKGFQTTSEHHEVVWPER